MNKDGYSSFDVLFTLLEYVNTQKLNLDITHLKIHKLIYFCHGYYLAITKKPLLNEFFQAWKYGPVVPSLYNAFKNYTKENEITLNADLCNQHDIKLINEDLVSSIIEQVITLYGNKKAFELVELSHDPAGPWFKSYNETLSIIHNADIQSYFEKFIR